MALTYDSKLKELLANEKAKAILDELLPGLSTHPAKLLIQGKALSEICKLPQANIPAERAEQVKERINSAGL